MKHYKAMKKLLLFFSLALLPAMLFTSCSDDDDDNYGSLMEGEALFIDSYEDYLDGEVVANGDIGVEFQDDGDVIGHSSDYDFDWTEWRMDGNTIVVANSDGNVERYSVIRLDRQTGEFVARCNFNEDGVVDYRLIYGMIDSDKYD